MNYVIIFFFVCIGLCYCVSMDSIESFESMEPTESMEAKGTRRSRENIYREDKEPESSKKYMRNDSSRENKDSSGSKESKQTDGSREKKESKDSKQTDGSREKKESKDSKQTDGSREKKESKDSKQTDGSREKKESKDSKQTDGSREKKESKESKQTETTEGYPGNTDAETSKENNDAKTTAGDSKEYTTTQSADDDEARKLDSSEERLLQAQSAQQKAKDLADTMDLVYKMLLRAAQFCRHIRIDAKQSEALKQFRIPPGRNVGCFLDCILKKSEVIAANGAITSGLVKQNILAVSGNIRLAATGYQITHRCNTVRYKKNIMYKECDRAIFIGKCFLENRRFKEFERRLAEWPQYPK